jgi:outer membrane protein assembly factor BamB
MLKHTSSYRKKTSHFAVEDGPWTSPTVTNTVVIVGMDSELLGISRDLSTTTWTRSLLSDRLNIIAGKPARVGEKVVVAADTPPNNVTVFAIDPGRGTVHWKRSLGEAQAYPPVVDPYDSGNVLVRTKSALHAITTEGRKRWIIDDLPPETKISPYYRNTLTPGADEEFYYVTSTDELLAIDRETRKIAWRVEVNQPLGPPVSDANRVYVPAGGNGFRVVEKRTGEMVWRIGDVLNDRAVDHLSCHRSPIVEDEVVFLNVGEYHVSLTKDGTIDWKTKLRGDITSGPVSSANANYVSGKHLYKIDKQTGNKRAVIENIGTHLTPTVTGKSLFVSGIKKLYKYEF